MLWRAWHRTIGQFPNAARTVAGVSIAAVVAGFANAILVVAIVLVAVELGGANTASLSLPLIDDTIDRRAIIGVAAWAALVMTAAHAATELLTVRFTRNSLLGVQRRLIAAYLEADPEHRRGMPNTALSDGLTGLAGEMTSVANGYCLLLGGALGMIPILAVAAAVDPAATLVVVAVGFVIAAITSPLSRTIRVRSKRRVRRREELVENANHWTRLRDQIRMFGAERAVADLLGADATAAADATASARRSQRLLVVGRNDIILTLVVIALAVLDAVDPASIAAAGTVVLLLLRALQSAQSVQRSAQDLQAVLPAVERVFARIDELEAARRSQGTTSISDLDHVAVRDVSYRHSSGDRDMVLRNVSLRIRRGEIVALVGPSGSGKSTLVQILLRLARPTTGSVQLDGVTADDVVDADWSRLVSGILQEPELLDGTVAENIAFLRTGLSRDEIVGAARRAHIHDEILDLPAGYDTHLGVGSGLSGGQRQRIGIARALIGEPRLLVLDEPTSALDPHSEQLVRQTLDELRERTAVVVVAHRPSLLEIADRVVTLEKGRITATLDQVRRA